MASIQKVKNKRGISYRVIIRKSGQKPISKTFKSKTLAHQFISEIELSCEDKQRHLLSDLTFEELAQKYLNQVTTSSIILPLLAANTFFCLKQHTKRA